MSTILTQLTIQSGADWAEPLSVTSDGTHPLDPTSMVMEMRRDLNPQAQLLARLDMTGDGDGSITYVNPGNYELSLSADFTGQMPWGRGFWDIFGIVATKRVPVASGVVFIRPRTTR